MWLVVRLTLLPRLCVAGRVWGSALCSSMPLLLTAAPSHDKVRALTVRSCATYPHADLLLCENQHARQAHGLCAEAMQLMCA